MAMDFIKSCTTNVQSLVGTQKVTVRQYTRAVTFAQPDGVLDTLCFLRQHNILCAAWHDGSDENDVWVFLPAGETAFPSEISERLAQWTLAIDELYGSEAIKSGFDIDDILCGAIEGSLSFSLGRSCGAMRLGCCTWVLPVREDEEDGHSWMMMSVSMRYIPDEGDGTMSFTTTVKSTSMALVAGSEPRGNLRVRISPSGAEGRLLSGEEGSKVPAAFASTSWREHVISACSAEGVELQEPVEWLGVAMSEGENRYITWPTQLCLALGSRQRNVAHGKNDWRQYFDSATDAMGISDALMDAEDFYNSSAQREQELADAQASASKQDESVPDAGQDIASALDMTSPPLLHRPDLQAVEGVYPTPPDGLQPGHPLHPQISSDSVPASQAQNDSHQLAGEPQDQTDQDAADARPRIPSIVSPVGVPPYQRRSSDDLFGDMDNIDFNGDEVGDADFSFFDEPDEVPADASMRDAEEPPAGRGAVEMEAETAPVEPLKEAGGAADMEAQEDETFAAPDQTDTGADDKTQEDGHDVEANLPSLQDQTGEDATVPAASITLPPSAVEEKPLSPFGIRERLLPPPIPASAIHQPQDHDSSRRRSSFGPLTFNTSLSIATDRRYSAFDPGKDTAQVSGPSQPPPLQHKRKRSEDRQNAVSDDEEDEATTSSGSGDTSTDELDDRTSQGEPKDDSVSRKRKWDGSYMPQGPAGRDTTGSTIQPPGDTVDANVGIAPMLMELFNSSAPHDYTTQSVSSKEGSHHGVSTTFNLSSPDAPNSTDIVMTAQIVAEQSVTCTDNIVRELDVFGMSEQDGDESHHLASRSALDELPSLSASIASATTEALAALVPDIKPSDVSSLALLKEAHIPPRPPSTATKGQPRPPPPRPDPAASGPDISALSVPFIRVRRSDDTMDMLPTALNFWEALGLGPASGPKDIRHFLLVPENEAVEIATDDFIEGLKTAYEGCKLGSHSEKVVVDGDEDFDALDSTRIVALDRDASFEDAVTAYMHHCQAMGEQLAEIAFTEGVVTTVVYIINPFPGREAKHHLCAAFWELCKTYRKGVERARRSDKELLQRSPSDVVLQLLPLEMICAPGHMIIPTAAQMALLAREIYDRCPPTPAALNHTSPLPIPAAPAVELTPALAKRVGFQLAADAPVDLLHEASILHLAYATSNDGQWLSAAWTDNTSRYQHSVAFCLRGRSFADLAAELWSRTMDVLSARSVSWRVFVTSPAPVSASEADCWRNVIRDGTERAQMLSVTLLCFHPTIELQLTAPPTTDPTQQPGAGFLTPVSTPQPSAASGSMTVSPDATGQPAIAPPTPAPSETAAAIAEQDPEACLVDLEDETFSVLLDSLVGKSAFLSPSPSQDHAMPLAYTALIKRGSSTANNLPVAGTSLSWTLRVRPAKPGSGCVIDEGSARHAEMMLREVAGMFRGLGLLGRVRGIGCGGSGLVPVHVLVAMTAVGGLEGMVG